MKIFKYVLMPFLVMLCAGKAFAVSDGPVDRLYRSLSSSFVEMEYTYSAEGVPSAADSEALEEAHSAEAVPAEAGTYLRSVTTQEESKICDGRKTVTGLFSFTDIDCTEILTALPSSRAKEPERIDESDFMTSILKYSTGASSSGLST